jgi:2-polyprenyl-3-methyl-5-hydroxy-6-metoxy-1,4-benzoquinol methylase
MVERKKSRQKYNWLTFTKQSDVRYKNARTQKDGYSALKSHNILSSGDVELRFIQDMIVAVGGKKFNKGKALDVCCGAGHMSSCLVDMGMQVVGFDLNKDAISLATSNVKDATFYVSDAVNLVADITTTGYDLILIREAHPFSRINDFDFQKKILDQYFSILNSGGVLVIAHANSGGRMPFPSIDFVLLAKWAEDNCYSFTGPFYMFLYKHLNLKSPNQFLIKAGSLLSLLLSKIFNQRWIQFVCIVKKMIELQQFFYFFIFKDLYNVS